MSPHFHHPLTKGVGAALRALAPVDLRRFRPLFALAVLLTALFTLTPGAPANPANAHAHELACEVSGLELPLAVFIEPGVDVAVVTSAMNEWNSIRPGTFVRITSTAGADVRVVPSHATWVEMPCGKLTSVVHVGDDVNLDYWMAHELGHTLGFADHIKEGMDASRYINPQFCPDSGYEGIMSYCTARANWWGDDDRAMMAESFPVAAQAAPPEPSSLPNRLFVPGVSRR